MQKFENELHEIESKIYLIRGEKVLLSHDLAKLYQVKRNRKRFPSDLMIVLSDQELRNLRSQFATSSLAWGGTRTPPFAFTEQGVAMLSTVLNNDRAIEVNIGIMRTFVRLRKILNLDQEFETRMAQLEKKYEGQFRLVFDAIRELMSTHSVPRKRIIGLGDED